MKKILIRMVPAFFTLVLTCCGGTLQDVLGESDYTKYKVEQAKKAELPAGKIS